jgi:hypothetical protein
LAITINLYVHCGKRHLTWHGVRLNEIAFLRFRDSGGVDVFVALFPDGRVKDAKHWASKQHLHGTADLQLDDQWVADHQFVVGDTLLALNSQMRRSGGAALVPHLGGVRAPAGEAAGPVAPVALDTDSVAYAYNVLNQLGVLDQVVPAAASDGRPRPATARELYQRLPEVPDGAPLRVGSVTAGQALRVAGRAGPIVQATVESGEQAHRAFARASEASARLSASAAQLLQGNVAALQRSLLGDHPHLDVETVVGAAVRAPWAFWNFFMDTLDTLADFANSTADASEAFALLSQVFPDMNANILAALGPRFPAQARRGANGARAVAHLGRAGADAGAAVGGLIGAMYGLGAGLVIAPVVNYSWAYSALVYSVTGAALGAFLGYQSGVRRAA